MVGDNFNIIKTTFDFNFDLYQAFYQALIHKNMDRKRHCQLKSFYLFTCKLVIRKKLDNK